MADTDLPDLDGDIGMVRLVAGAPGRAYHGPDRRVDHRARPGRAAAGLVPGGRPDTDRRSAGRPDRMADRADWLCLATVPRRSHDCFACQATVPKSCRIGRLAIG